MNAEAPMDIIGLFKEVLGEKMNNFIIPPPSFTLMKSEIVAFNKERKTLSVKVPVLEAWQNPFSTMQGGLIVGAIDSAVGALSLLIGESITRTIETKYLKGITMEVKHIYVKAKLVEHRKKRLRFDVSVEDILGVVYTRAKVVNFMV